MVKSDNNLKCKILDDLNIKKEILVKTQLFKEILTSLGDIEISYIRCLGLGSISNSSLAMYQLALLELIISHYKKSNTDESVLNVSFWDPAFSTEDIDFISKTLEYSVVEDIDLSKNLDSTLFYMPHFPIEILEKFITDTKPIYILSNDVTAYTIKFTDLKFFELYPNCARLSKLITDKSNKKMIEKNEKIPINDDFQVVVKKKNRKRKNNSKYIPPVVDYDLPSAFFKDVLFDRIQLGNDTSQAWDSAFTDLSFMTILQ